MTKQVRWFQIGSVAMISFLAFESLAVGTVLPVAAAEFGATSEYSLAFGVTFAAMIIAIAWAGPWVDYSGARAPLVTGGVLFVIGLVVVSVAHSMTVLAIGRVIQGFGSGLLSVVLYALVGRLIADADRPRMFAAFSTAWVVPSLIGPAVAGLAADTVSWRWVFLGVTVPAVGAMCATVASTVGLDESQYRSTATPNRTVLIAAIVAGLSIALAQFTAPRAQVGFLIVAGLSLIVAMFAVRAMLPPRTLTGAPGVPRIVLTSLLLAGAFFAAEIYLPLYLVHEDSMSPFFAGSVMTGAALLWALGSQLQVRVPADGARRNRIPVFGAAAVAAALIEVVVAFAFAAPWPVIFLAWAIAGLGMGAVYPTLSILLLAASPPQEQGANSGALKLSESAGTALAIMLAGAVFPFVLPWGHIGFAVTLIIPLLAALLTVLVAAGLRTTARRPAADTSPAAPPGYPTANL